MYKPGEAQKSCHDTVEPSQNHKDHTRVRVELTQLLMSSNDKHSRVV